MLGPRARGLVSKFTPSLHMSMMGPTARVEGLQKRQALRSKPKEIEGLDPKRADLAAYRDIGASEEPVISI